MPSVESLKYTDISISDITESILSDVLETSLETLRKNNDETRAIVKWSGDDPSWVKDLGLVVRTHTEALAYYIPANGWGTKDIP
jgi:hypothetical protein